MADRAKKISELNALTSPSANSLLVIVDNPGLANVETKKITLGNLFGHISANVTVTGITSLGNVTSNNITASQTISANVINVSNSVIVGNVTITPGSIRTGGLFNNGNILYTSNNRISYITMLSYDVPTNALVANGVVATRSLYSANDFASIFAVNFSNIRVGAFDNVNSYSQAMVWNSNTGSRASSDYIVTADEGDDSRLYADFGIASGTYSYPGFEIIKPHDAYLFSANTDLLLGTGGSNTGVIVFTGTPNANATHSQFHSNGMLEVRNTTRTGKLFFSNTTSTPANSSATGSVGEVRVDSSYIYVCVATNTWKRASISTW